MRPLDGEEEDLVAGSSCPVELYLCPGEHTPTWSFCSSQFYLYSGEFLIRMCMAFFPFNVEMSTVGTNHPDEI